ncbi:Panacea domain-containing protein [Caulobacter sp. Root1455]|uniref:Panacea domain-containing protein n=1 Tax=Caulobacter sp. Root1455 TaxID=1736465 RepID=UPI0009E9196D|nr:type II toxin-antitoxin system antitoxin SocA domain-containing protein [Caulobacter sp. Root1455]
MSYDGRAVANFVLDFCEQKERIVTNLSLQKIVFFCHVWSLIELGKPLIRHDFEAWEYGPVLPYLYREFRMFDRLPITERAKKIDPLSGERRIVHDTFDLPTSELLERIIDFYSRMRAGDLVEISHVEGGPWYRSWHHSGVVNPGMKIDQESIVQFYSRARLPFSIQ